MKSESWFLGSNSARGFYSLYGGFRREGGFLRVIKGGPGTGKSSLMRRIAAAAEENGCSVEYILCSGDPDSLDGIYIPEKNMGYADGTSPHILDPGVYGAEGDYLDVGAAACGGRRLPGAEDIAALTESYRRQYARAYELLAAAAGVSPSLTMAYAPDDAIAAVRARAAGAAAREMPRIRPGRPGETRRRFLGGLTCRGRVLLGETLSQYAPRLYLLDNRLGLGFEFTREIAERAERCGEETVICPHWLRPERIEAVLLPELGLGFAALDMLAAYPEQHRCLHLDRMAGAEHMRCIRAMLREDERLEERLLTRAGQHLAAAKALHDELEARYRPHINTAALDELAENELRRLGF